MEHTRKTDKDRKSERDKMKKRRQHEQYLFIGIVALVVIAIILLIVLLPSDKDEDASAGTPGAVTSDNGGGQSSTKPQPEATGSADENDPENASTDPIEDTNPPAEQPEYEVDFSAPVELYWNVDRAIYTNGTAREPDSDGNYKIRFSYKGELTEKTVASKTLAESIDTMDTMKLLFDDQGIVVNAIGPWDAASEIAVNVYFQAVTADTITINTEPDMSGEMVYLTMSEDHGFYDVRSDAQTPGAALQAGDLKQGDRLLIYGDFDGNVVYVYVTAHAEG